MRSLPQNNVRILVVEDELPMRVALSDCLLSEGYRVLEACDGQAAIETALKEQPSIILLDVMLPKVDGFSVCRELRRLGYRNPILFLSARGLVNERVAGLDAGADDYIAKPFSSDELLARVRARLRRSMTEDSDHGIAKVDIHGVSLDFTSLEARSPSGVDIHFTRKEWQMMLLLCGSAGEAISRDRFLDLVWGVNAFPSTRTVDNHIASIRAKLKSGSSQPDTECILTVHGLGYRLKPDSIKILQIHDNNPGAHPHNDAHDKPTDAH